MSSDTAAGATPAAPEADSGCATAAAPGAGPPGALAAGPGTAADRADWADRADRARRARRLSWLALSGITVSALIMIGASAVRDSWMHPPLPMPHPGPPWDLQPVHLPLSVVTVSLWLAALLGAASVAAGLAAVHRGARPSARALLAAGLLATAVLAVLPPTGSTDALDYASYGRIAALGHNPYLVAPEYLRQLHNAFARSVPVAWEHAVSVYGPLATAEQYLAARIGGTSPALIIGVLKLLDAAAFAGVAIAADRVLRGDPAQRLRAHLLWTVNPLLLWDIMAAGHLDVLGAAAGLLGLLAIGRKQDAGRPSLARALAAGALLGIAADIKINYIVLALALAWVLRRAPAALAAASAAALAVLIPSYAGFGLPAVRALAGHRNAASADSFYRLFMLPGLWSHAGMIAATGVTGAAILLMRRLPDGPAAWPVMRVAVAFSVSWLFLWPYQFPWYDVMLLCVLILYPASRLDWLVLVRLAAGTLPNMPGNAFYPAGNVLYHVHHVIVFAVAPVVLLAAAAAAAALCVSRRWNLPLPAVVTGDSRPA